MASRLGRFKRLGAASAVAAGGIGCFLAQRSTSIASAEDELAPVDMVSSSVYGALINRKVNACPMAVRVAWHSTSSEAAR